MKMLMIFCDRFAYKPTIKTLEMADENALPANFEKVQTAFLQVEEQDEEREADVTKKLLKNLKWVCGKNNTRKVILHSFAHLSESKANPKFTVKLFNRIEERLQNAGYEVEQTPFGYFL
ncbi:MAG: threonyl-tRNA synthetase editing domain-containing protein, partial [Bacteroidales bacterium]|nr:threonyl-tRNA synthetase editing domain-containing protein [Bacteroidales bacterium]